MSETVAHNTTTNAIHYWQTNASVITISVWKPPSTHKPKFSGKTIFDVGGYYPFAPFFSRKFTDSLSLGTLFALFTLLHRFFLQSWIVAPLQTELCLETHTRIIIMLHFLGQAEISSVSKEKTRGFRVFAH